MRLRTDIRKGLRADFCATAGARYIEAQQCHDRDSHNSDKSHWLLSAVPLLLTSTNETFYPPSFSCQRSSLTALIAAVNECALRTRGLLPSSLALSIRVCKDAMDVLKRNTIRVQKTRQTTQHYWFIIQHRYLGPVRYAGSRSELISSPTA